jgi:hypothetical protein
MRLLSVLLAALGTAVPAAAQLNCSVSVDLRQVQSTEYEFLEDLEVDIEDYLNTTRWSQDRFEDEERITCSVQITLNEPVSLSRFRAQIVVQGQRPIYGTPSSTLVFRVLDADWVFDYNRGQPLVLDLNRFDSFTSVLDFYALLLLGYDYDTFSELGGTPYFQRALDIAERASGLQAEGWTSFGEDQTRTALIRQLTGERYAPLRRGYFVYHFGGLDRFLTDTEEAQADVFAVIQSLFVLYNELNARRYATDVFFGAKSEELVQILQDSEQANEALDLLLEMDPTRRADYEELLN